MGVNEGDEIACSQKLGSGNSTIVNLATHKDVCIVTFVDVEVAFVNSGCERQLTDEHIIDHGFPLKTTGRIMIILKGFEDRNGMSFRIDHLTKFLAMP